MFRLCSARTARLAICVTALSLGLQTGGELAPGAHAASSKSAASRNSSASNQPMMGKLHSATKNAFMLLLPGSKKLTHIQLNAKTRYIVNGKRVAKQPAFTRGLLISVVTIESKGSYTARIVIVGWNAQAAPGAVGRLPARSPTALPPGTISLAGAVTLTSAASVTLKTLAGTETIKLTVATRYIVKGKSSSSKPILHAGETVRIAAVQSHGVLVGKVFTVG
jgi:hypothetical protein